MLRKVEEEESKAVEKVKLVTSDGVTMEVEISIVKEMETIQAFINALDTDDSVIFPLPESPATFESNHGVDIKGI
ncbi:hypothetical protein ACSQ67_014515 [Phaseolus vulgaris]